MVTMVTIADSISSRITLNDGVQMPLFGLGVFKAVEGDAEKSVLFAIKNGYRVIDTAVFYKNEDEVGKAISKSGVAREDLFIVTKCWKDEHGAEELKKGFHESLKRLNLDYLDLYLIHTPTGGKIVETYKAMLELKKEGLIRSVGVSNFGIEHFKGMKEAGLPMPSVNQIELHPWMRRDQLVDYCRQVGIAVMGYSPLGKGHRFDQPEIQELAKKYKKSAGQMMIRWSVQKGFICIPKSSKEERIVENSLVFDWTIEDEDFKNMDDFPTKTVCGSNNPEETPWMP